MGPPRTPQGAGWDTSTARGSSEVTHHTRKVQPADGNAAERRVAGETPDGEALLPQGGAGEDAQSCSEPRGRARARTLVL